MVLSVLFDKTLSPCAKDFKGRQTLTEDKKLATGGHSCPLALGGMGGRVFVLRDKQNHRNEYTFKQIHEISFEISINY